MRTATVRDLRNHYTDLLRWISAGEDVVITQRGVAVARLTPVRPRKLDWVGSPEVKRERKHLPKLSAKQSAALIAQAFGPHADVLHVAVALQMGAKVFVCFDDNQKKLARAEGLGVPG